MDTAETKSTRYRDGSVQMCDGAVYGWCEVCTNSFYMGLLCFYVREWIRGWIMRMPETQNKRPRHNPGAFYKVDEQIRSEIARMQWYNTHVVSCVVVSVKIGDWVRMDLLTIGQVHKSGSTGVVLHPFRRFIVRASCD